MSWVWWSVLAMVGWGIWPILNKLALRSLRWPHLLLASWLVMTAAVVAALANRLDPRPLLSRDGAIAVVAAATSLVAVVAFYLALRSVRRRRSRRPRRSIPPSPRRSRSRSSRRLPLRCSGRGSAWLSWPHSCWRGPEILDGRARYS